MLKARLADAEFFLTVDRSCSSQERLQQLISLWQTVLAKPLAQIKFEPGSSLSGAEQTAREAAHGATADQADANARAHCAKSRSDCRD